MLILTLINLAPICPNLDCCFELFGFDIMIDANYKPWLLEVNMPPAIGIDNYTD